MQIFALSVLSLGLISALSASPPAAGFSPAPSRLSSTIRPSRSYASMPAPDVPKVKELLQSLGRIRSTRDGMRKPCYLGCHRTSRQVERTLCSCQPRRSLPGHEIHRGSLARSANAARILEVVANVPAFHDEVPTDGLGGLRRQQADIRASEVGKPALAQRTRRGLEGWRRRRTNPAPAQPPTAGE